jgi:hypothetical protein
MFHIFPFPTMELAVRDLLVCFSVCNSTHPLAAELLVLGLREITFSAELLGLAQA